MKNKIRLFIGWFGVLTPVYAAGALTVLLGLGFFQDMMLIIPIIVVSVVNCFLGRIILKTKVR